MIKLWLFAKDAERAIAIAFNKETDMQRAVDRHPEHIFFMPKFLDSTRELRSQGWSEADIARWFNMKVTDLRQTLAEEKTSRHAEVR